MDGVWYRQKYFFKALVGNERKEDQIQIEGSGEGNISEIISAGTGKQKW